MFIRSIRFFLGHAPIPLVPLRGRFEYRMYIQLRIYEVFTDTITQMVTSWVEGGSRKGALFVLRRIFFCKKYSMDRTS